MESESKKRVLHSSAGVFVALGVLLLFVLAATFLKSLVFGMIAAYFLLPLEKFFEERFFQSRPAKTVSRFLSFLVLPFSALRNRFMRRSLLEDPAKREYRNREALVLKSTIAAFLTCIAALIFLFGFSASVLLPGAIRTGQSINRWIAENPSIKNAERKVTLWLDQTRSEEENPIWVSSAPSAKDAPTLRKTLEKLRPQIHSFLTENGTDVLFFAFSKGKGILSSIFSFVSYLGKFAFDLLLFLFFFLFFIQKMALFTDPSGKSNVGEWCIQGLFHTAWFPSTTEKTRSDAAEIINHISGMFQCWIRGYITIIFLEIVIYLTLFSLFSVPYAIPLAFIAGSTILLPFVGLLASMTLTFGVCLIFCEVHLLTTLIGIALAYALVNGLLEQLILYPTLVGGSIGLSMIETIIVVLLGGMFAGIPGMIFAVPTAAVLKYLIPKLYELKKKAPSVKTDGAA